jgi:hypothetical protein
MIDFEELDSIVQYGRGVAADIIGEPYDIYRLSDGSDGRTPSSGSIINTENKIYSDLRIRMMRSNAAIAEENTNIYDMIFAGMCDAGVLKVGDVACRIHPYRNDYEMFTVADLRPLSYNVFVRTEIQASLSVSWGSGDSEQLLGYVKYQGAGKQNERAIILRDGYYYIGDPDDADFSPAVVPLGIQPYKRLGPTPEIKQPTTTHRSELFIYVPILNGLYLEPGYIISDQNGNRYQIQNVTSFTVGLQGYQLIAESLFV